VEDTREQQTGWLRVSEKSRKDATNLILGGRITIEAVNVSGARIKDTKKGSFFQVDVVKKRTPQ